MRILVVSSDASLLSTRALLLSSAGFEVFMALDLHIALRAAHYYKPNIVVIGHTLSDGGRHFSYFGRLEESIPDMHYVCLREGANPRDFLRVCPSAVHSQHGIDRMHMIPPSKAALASVA